MVWAGASPNRTRGRTWARLRARVLAEEPICRWCRERGAVSAASKSVVCDHIVPLTLGGTDARGNLAGMCKACHDEKTLAEAAMAQGKRAPKRKVAVGHDGWPLAQR